ncbi:hypothetical protein ACFX2C_017074 [Malus domestica]
MSRDSCHGGTARRLAGARSRLGIGQRGVCGRDHCLACLELRAACAAVAEAMDYVLWAFGLDGAMPAIERDEEVMSLMGCWNVGHTGILHAGLREKKNEEKASMG